MAIQFARVERVSRSQGKNACCKSAYNARTRINDLNTNITYTFEQLKDNVYHEILLPKHVDPKFKDVSLLANEVEITEKRKNSQLYKEYVLALPDDPNISLEIKKEMINEFIKGYRFIEEGLGVQVDLHKPHSGSHNWHAHLLVATRRFREDGLGFGEKARDLEPQVRGGQKYYVQSHNEINIGQFWKDVQNEVFERYGLENRVDEISNMPGVHLGPVRMRGLMNEAAQFHEERRVVNPPVISNANELLDLITEKNAVFSIHDLKDQLNNMSDEKKKLKIIDNALTSKRTLALYHSDGRSTHLFTTVEVRKEEEMAIRIADRIRDTRAHVRVNVKEAVAERLEAGVITAHQAEALLHLVGDSSSPSSLRMLQGRAGTGKSHVLGQLRSLLEPCQKVIGLAPTHRALAELKAQGYERPDTLRGFLFKYKYGRVEVPHGSLFVVDEAGMAGTDTLLEFSKVVRATKSEIVFSGDDLQLASVERGGLFKIMIDRYKAATLDVIIRQKHEWGREVSRAFSDGDVERGVSVLQANGKLNFDTNKAESMSRLLADWSKSQEQLSSRLILTIANKDVDALNQGARQILKSEGRIIGAEFEINNKATKAVFGCGDRIVLTETHKALNVKNGEFATIAAINHDQLAIVFDSGRRLTVNPTDLNFKHGYAVTVFKSQGASIKDVYVLHDFFATKNNAYVEMSRHVDDLHVYCNTYSTKDQAALIEQLSRSLDLGSSLNYVLESDIRESGTSIFGNIKSLVKNSVQIVADRFHQNEEYYVFDEQKLNANTIKAVINESHQELQQVVGLESEFISTNQTNVASVNMSSASLTSNIIPENTLQKASGSLAWNDSVASIRQALRLQAERVALDLLGEPNAMLSNANTLRFGEHGKLAVEIRGEKAGVWHDFSQVQGGDLLALISREKELDFKGALNFAKSYAVGEMIPNTLQEQSLRKLSEQILLEDKAQKLNKLYQSTKAIDSNATLAREYLEGKRGISHFNISEDVRCIDSLWNGSVRQNMPAIVSFARDFKGEIRAASVVYLDQELGDKLQDLPAKRAFGKVSGSYIEIQKANIGVTVLAEGLETALSLKEARVPGNILSTMGIHNFKHYEPSDGEVILIAADNDLPNIARGKALELATGRLKEKGATVLIIQPEKNGDFNDILKERGKDAVYDLVMPQLVPYLSRDWLDVWEKGDRNILSSDILLNNTDGMQLKDQYRELVQQRQKALDLFADKNQEALTRLLELDLNYDLKKFKTKICDLSPDKRDHFLQQEIATSEQRIQDQIERASTPHGLTKQEFAATVSKNYEHIKSAYDLKNILLLKDPGFGAYDFKGELHSTYSGYLAAIGLDKEVQPLIDYETPLGKQIKIEADHKLKIDAEIARVAAAKIEEQRQAQLTLDRERASTPYNLTKEEFKTLVQKNVKYLNDGYRGDLKCARPGFGVKDFKGEQYITEGRYLNALGCDKQLQPLIDYQDDLGKQIKQHVENQRFLQRMRENDRGRDM